MKSVPLFAKILLTIQTIIILFLSSWIYQEYLNNRFLQLYVNSSLQGTTLTPGEIELTLARSYQPRPCG